MKQCCSCKKQLPLTSYRKDKHNNDGLDYNCKVCKSVKEAKRHKKNPKIRKQINDKWIEKRKEYYSKRKDSYKNQYLIKRFGIDLSQYNTMLSDQNGVCAICLKPERTVRNRNLAVDHCHKTGKIMGLLCSHCNRALGLLQDNIEILKKTIIYLGENNET